MVCDLLVFLLHVEVRFAVVQMMCRLWCCVCIFVCLAHDVEVHLHFSFCNNFILVSVAASGRGL